MTTFSEPATPTRPDPVLPPVRPLTFGQLTRVETRKQLDTRGSRLLMGSFLAVVVAVAIWQIATVDSDVVGIASFAAGPVQMLVMLAPVIGLMAMTAEWTQRTALTTFTLAPRRMPVIAAKFVSAILLTAALIVVGLLLTILGALLAGTIGGGGSDLGDLGSVFRGALINGLLTSVMAAAIGASIAQTAVAVATYFVAPTAFSLLALAVLKDAAPWFDVFTTFDRLASENPWTDLPQTLTSVGLWVLLPAVIGIVRTLRREVK